MDVSRNYDMLGELANDAALERTDFVVQATEQLAKFLDRHRDRVAALGGLTLIDDSQPDHPDTEQVEFRVPIPLRGPGHRAVDDRLRDRPDPRASSWSSTTRSDLPRSPRPRGRPPDWRRADGDGRPDGRRRDRAEETFGLGVPVGDDAYGHRPTRGAAGQPAVLGADDEEGAALALCNLALDFQERSGERANHRAVRGVCGAGHGPAGRPDHRRRRGRAAGLGRHREVPGRGPAGEDASGEWRELSGGDELVEFYDPTDVFGDLADALAEAFPAIAPDLEAEAARKPDAVEDAVAAEDVEDQPAEDEDAVAGRRRDRSPRHPRRRRHATSDAHHGGPVRREVVPGTWLHAWHAP